MSKQSGKETGPAELNGGSHSVQRLVRHVCPRCGKTHRGKHIHCGKCKIIHAIDREEI